MASFGTELCDAITLLLGSSACVELYERVYIEVYRGLQRSTMGSIARVEPLTLVCLRVTLKGLRVSKSVHGSSCTCGTARLVMSSYALL